MTVQIGLLGAAKIAPKAMIEPARGRSDVNIAAVASRDEQRGRAFAADHDIAQFYPSYETLVDDPAIDAIYCALPPSAHAAIVIRALERGKHVLCEKPFAMSATQAEQMARAQMIAQNTTSDADRSVTPPSRAPRTQVLMEAFHYRYHPAFLFVLRELASGAYGAVRSIGGVFRINLPEKPGELRFDRALGGGALMDLGCYPLHMARTIYGGEPTVVAAHCNWSRPGRAANGVDIATDATLAFPAQNGTATIACTFAHDGPPQSRLTVEAENGRIEFTGPIAPHLGHIIRTQNATKTWEGAVAGRATYDHQLDAFIDAVMTDAAVLTGPADAIANMAAIDAIYAAAE